MSCLKSTLEIEASVLAVSREQLGTDAFNCAEGRQLKSGSAQPCRDSAGGQTIAVQAND